MRTLWWTLAIAGMSLISIVLSEHRTFDPLQNLSLTAAAPIEGGIRDLADPASDFFQGIFDRDVIAQDPSGLKRALAINRGSQDGLDEGMVVLSRDGSLVATVSLVYDDFAWLRLITDPNSAVNVAVLPPGGQSAAARGIAAGDLRSGVTLEMLPT